jgi:hypothetical protein
VMWASQAAAAAAALIGDRGAEVIHCEALLSALSPIRATAAAQCLKLRYV